MSFPFKWELSILSPFQISSLHLGTKTLSQFSDIGYLTSERFCCQRLYTITARCAGPWLSSSVKSLFSWSRKGSIRAFDSVEILPAKSILSGKFLGASILATSVSRWSWSGMLIFPFFLNSFASGLHLFLLLMCYPVIPIFANWDKFSGSLRWFELADVNYMKKPQESQL